MLFVEEDLDSLAIVIPEDDSAEPRFEKCPSCHLKYELTRERVGRLLDCGCGARFRAPGPVGALTLRRRAVRAMDQAGNQSRRLARVALKSWDSLGIDRQRALVATLILGLGALAWWL